MSLRDLAMTEKKSVKQAPENQKAGKKFEDEIKSVCDLYQSLNVAYIQKFEVPTIFIPKKFSKRQGKEVGGFMARRSKTGFDFVGGVVKTKSAIFIETKSTDSGDIPVNQEKTGIKKHQLQTLLWLQSIGFDCFFLWEIRRANEVFKMTPRDVVNMIGVDGKKLTILDCQEHKIPRMVKVRYQGQFYYDFLECLN